MALVIILATAAPVLAQGDRVGYTFTQATFQGPQDLTVDAVGFRFLADAHQATLHGYGQSIDLETRNLTSSSVLRTSIDATPGGIKESYSNATFSGLAPETGTDVVIVADTAHVAAQGTCTLAGQSQVEQLQETSYFDSRRPLLTQNVGEAMQITGCMHTIRFTGSFQVSIWSWNFAIEDTTIPTGTARNNPQTVPVLGTEITSDVVSQVAHLTVQNGWLELTQMPSETATLYGENIDLAGTGQATIQGLTGQVTKSIRATDDALAINGDYRLKASPVDRQPYLAIIKAQAATLNGQSIALPEQDPDVVPGSTITSPRTGLALKWSFGATFLGLLIVGAILHGPMQGFRFTRIQRRFDDRDYITVLQRIDTFTRKRRYQRRASFLKAISLLSLESYKEAGLYLGTLTPGRGPDPATTAFLKACAAAGQGKDAVAISHLTDCFALDDGYREEAKLVPVLAPLLAYFDLANRGSPA